MKAFYIVGLFLALAVISIPVQAQGQPKPPEGFILPAGETESQNFFDVNMDVFVSKNEKVCFINFLFAADKLTIHETVINAGKLRVFADKSITADEATEFAGSLYSKTVNFCKNLSVDNRRKLEDSARKFNIK